MQQRAFHTSGYFFLYRGSLRNANSNYANFQKVQLKFNFFELLGNTEGFLDANSSYASSIYATIF